jgi:hypothetical protein
LVHLKELKKDNNNMKLVQWIDGKPTFSDEAKMLKPFRQIIERDKGGKGKYDVPGDSDGRNKIISTKELAFIIYWCSFKSPFDHIKDDKQKEEEIKSALMLPDNWKADSLIWEGVDKWKELTYTSKRKLVDTAKRSFDKLEEFLDQVDLQATTNSGSLVFSPKALQEALQEIPTTIKKLYEAEEIAYKEMDNNQQGGGNGKRQIEKGLFEDDL